MNATFQGFAGRIEKDLMEHGKVVFDLTKNFTDLSDIVVDKIIENSERYYVR